MPPPIDQVCIVSGLLINVKNIPLPGMHLRFDAKIPQSLGDGRILHVSFVEAVTDNQGRFQVSLRQNMDVFVTSEHIGLKNYLIHIPNQATADLEQLMKREGQ